MLSRTKWRSTILAGALGLSVFAAFTLPSVAQISIQFGRTPPPPLRWERRPPPPGPGFAWIDGYWGYRGNRYVWVPGRWDRSPYAGAYWVHPHYDHYQDGYHLHEGHWDREDHDDHHDWGRHDDDHGHR